MNSSLAGRTGCMDTKIIAILPNTGCTGPVRVHAWARRARGATHCMHDELGPCWV